MKDIKQKKTRQELKQIIKLKTKKTISQTKLGRNKTNKES